MDRNHPISQRPLAVLVWLRLVRVVQRISRAATEPMQAAGLSGPQLDLLAHVSASPGLTQQEYGEQLNVTKGNITQLLDKLAEKELLTRQREGKLSKIFLTLQGQEFINRLLPDHDRFIAERFAMLSQEEQQQLLKLLAKIERQQP